jgi:hypothetical protein
LNPRFAILIGVTFIIVGAVYYVFPVAFGGYVDWAGLTMLIALSAAMSIMFYVLLAGSPREPSDPSGPPPSH